MLAPDAALDQLMAGNARFTAGRLTSFDDNLAILRQHTEAQQEPFATVLSCADS
jgi:carbonic anhydrase